jgi:hypothetical protein
MQLHTEATRGTYWFHKDRRGTYFVQIISSWDDGGGVFTYSRMKWLGVGLGAL